MVALAFVTIARTYEMNNEHRLDEVTVLTRNHGSEGLAAGTVLERGGGGGKGS